MADAARPDEGLVEAVARSLVPFGLDPDDIVSDQVLREADGLRALPHPDLVRPAWTFYVGDARRVLAAIEEYHG